MLTQMRNAGLIKSWKDGKTFCYTEAVLEQFRETYVFGNELASMVISGPSIGKAMTLIAISLGVKPVCARPEFYSFLFRRAEVMEALKGWDGVTNLSTGRPYCSNSAVASEGGQ
jgi:hypothetical protein